MLGRLENLDQAPALGVDLVGVGSQDFGALDDIRACLYVVGPDSFDNLVIAAVVGVLGSAGGTKEAVGRPLQLRVAAAGRADNSGAVCLETSSVYC